MHNRQRTRHALMLALLMAGSLVFFGCPGKPSDAELQQLAALKEEYASLQREVTNKEREKADLEKKLADLNAKTKKCNDDQQVVKQRLAK